MALTAEPLDSSGRHWRTVLSGPRPVVSVPDLVTDLRAEPAGALPVTRPAGGSSSGAGRGRTPRRWTTAYVRNLFLTDLLEASARR